MIVNREGIVDNTSLLGVGMVKWAQIARVFVWEFQDHAQLILWISQLNPKTRLINILQIALPKSPGTFVSEMRRYCPDTVRIHWKPGVAR